jgi:hypothetical protein
MFFYLDHVILMRVKIFIRIYQGILNGWCHNKHFKFESDGI